MSSVDVKLISRLSTQTGYPVYVGELPQGVSFPALIIELLASERVSKFGYSDSAKLESTFAVHLWTETNGARLAAWLNVRDALQRWNESGVHDSYLEGVTDNYEPETTLFQRTVDVWIIHDEDT